MTDTDIVFVAGGKWTTYREMAQDAVDKVSHPPSYLNSFYLIHRYHLRRIVIFPSGFNLLLLLLL